MAGRLRTWRMIAAAALALSACSAPDMAGLEEGEAGKAAEIIDGDTLVLDTGLRVTLTGIEAPFGEAAFAREARAGLERMVLHRPVRLGYGGVRRYAPRAARAIAGEAKTATEQDQPAETALAQVFVQTEGGRWVWVQEAMLLEGLARVRTRKENRARAGELLRAEAQARAQGRGLWALRDYRVLNTAQAEAMAETLPGRCAQGPFLLVEGRVRAVSAEETRVYLTFGGPDAMMQDVTIGIYGDSVGEWRAAGPAFDSYEDKLVRVRGRAGNRGGPLICADHPEQIEILQQPAAG